MFKRKLYILVCALYLISLQALAMASSDKQILLGPILHFAGQDLVEHQWKVTALYLIRHNKVHPRLFYRELTAGIYGEGEVLGTRFGYDFVRYEMTVRQTSKMRKIFYGLPSDTQHSFFVPALGQSHNIMYHSCNGYQKEEDRKATGGIEPMWQQVNIRHSLEPYHLQLGGGDQIYADGLVHKQGTCSAEPHHKNTNGVFALGSLQKWLHKKKKLGYAPFTKEMAGEVERFYFDHYVRHYSCPEFAKFMASTPSLAQPDDHDYFDGCGSYPYFLQEGFVMAGIRKIAMWYAFTVQHQLAADAYVFNEEGILRPHNFLHVINDGKLAIYGVDARTERNYDQIVSPDSWDRILSELYELDGQIEHVIVMLGVPVVYASSEGLEAAQKTVEGIPVVKQLLPALPGFKQLFQRNIFDLPELADDLRDGWNHPAHVDERNSLIDQLQDFATNKNIRVSIISGDVHLGGMGLVRREGELWDTTTIPQIISSPVGNITPGSLAAKYIGHSGCCAQAIGSCSSMCLVKPLKSNGGEKKHALLSGRNFATLKIDVDSTLQIKWSMEKEQGFLKDYFYSIPAAK